MRLDTSALLSDLEWAAHLHGLQVRTEDEGGKRLLRIAGDVRQWGDLMRHMGYRPPNRPDRLVLISAKRRAEAEQIARERGLKHREWRYIPQHPTARERALTGLWAMSEEDLIGTFTDQERRALLWFGDWLRSKRTQAPGREEDGGSA